MSAIHWFFQWIVEGTYLFIFIYYSFLIMKHLLLYLSTIVLITMGCSPTTELIREREYQTTNTYDVDYSAIYYIHADADYLYHDPDGDPVRGNSGVLKTAFEVAKGARSGELFIYHQRPEKKLLGLFPQRSSRLYHYRNGQLINEVKYRHTDKKEAFLATEAELLEQYRVHNRAENHQNYLLYFGHEVPTENGTNYHKTLPDINVTRATFASGVQNFLASDDQRFELLVLSTCNNGTPAMAEQLMSFTDVVLASPQNLHLSHVDTKAMALLESEPGISTLQLGRTIAERTFERLKKDIETTIILSMYHLNDLQAYINILSTLTAVEAVTDRSVQYGDNVDCAQISPSEPEAYRQGVETWYKPARFGRRSSGTFHSGWGCKPGEN